jgi:AcrR family transcriptional regulator
LHSSEPTTPSIPLDARAARSGKALRAALLALLERKPFDQITVREIAAEAGVHYATFFRHQPTKEALLDDVAADQIDRLVELTLPVLDSVDSHAAVLALCVYVRSHLALWTVLLTGGAAGAMREQLLQIAMTLAATRAPDDDWLPVALAVKCSVSLIFETLAWWLAQPADAVTVDQVAAILHRLLSSVQLGEETRRT